jgi:ribonuclease T2
MAASRATIAQALTFVLAGLLPSGLPAEAAETSSRVPIGQGFDFYVLSLSWSPSYCAAEGENANRHQCGPGRPYGFVVHGLWPQFEHGYPEHCPSREPDRVPGGLAARFLDIMPSAGLIGYQWRKHGTCSGLSQEDYFVAVRAARDRIAVPPAYRATNKVLMVDPDQVEEDFVKSNPGLKADAIAVTCDGKFVREVRICMSKNLEFRPCPEVDRAECRRGRVLMPANRGD